MAQCCHRPYRDTRFAPHDIWLMANPVLFGETQIWVDNGKVWGKEERRLGGVYAPGNGEFSTPPFPLPPSAPLWLEASVLWQGGNHVGVPDGADEGHQAYVMVELRDASSGKVVAPREQCIITDVDLLHKAPLRWNNRTSIELGIAPSARLSARIFFRAATIHAFGAM